MVNPKIENKVCEKIDHCHKISMVLDHDLLEYQYADAIHKICKECDEFIPQMAEDIAEQLNRYKKYRAKYYPECLKEDDLIMIFLDTHLGIKADMLRSAKLYFERTSNPIPFTWKID